MTTTDYFDLAVRMCGLACACYAITGQVVKPGLRMLAKRSAKGGRLSRAQEAFYAWLTRTMSVSVGAAIGMAPLWPSWLSQEAWHPLIGAVAGSMAVPIHAAISKTLPARIKAVIAGGSVTKQ